MHLFWGNTTQYLSPCQIKLWGYCLLLDASSGPGRPTLPRGEVQLAGGRQASTKSEAQAVLTTHVRKNDFSPIMTKTIEIGSKFRTFSELSSAQLTNLKPH